MVTVEEPETISVGETKSVTLTGGDAVAYAFTPAQSWTYTLYVPSDYGTYPAEFHINTEYDMWEAGDYRGASAFDLVAGETYFWTIGAIWDMTDCPVTLVKADALTGLTLEAELTGYVGNVYTVNATVTPDLGVDRTVEWSSADEDVAYIEGYFPDLL